MTLVLYIAEIKGVDTYTKPGITTDLYSRTNAYTKIGNTAVIHFLAIAQPGFEGQIRTLEEDGKTYLKPHRSRFNGLDRTEYISVSKTGITPSVVEEYFRKKIEGIPSVHIVKKEYLPLNIESPDLKNFITLALKYPDKYLENF